MDHPRIALLIDADNASVRRIELILNELSGVGETSIRRAYGNWTKPELKGWAAVLLEHAIRPMQQYDYSTGKNASDMALVVDAMALYYTDRPDAFAIVSSDGDFTPLVMHLREKGAAVYGFGDHKTPEAFKSACSRFLVLDRLDVQEQEVQEQEVEAAGEAAGTPAERTTPLRVPTAQLKQDAKLVTLLRRAVQAAADDDGWALVGTVGSHIANQSSFDPRNYGYGKLSRLLEATELFDVRDEGRPTLSVRDKRQAGRR